MSIKVSLRGPALDSSVGLKRRPTRGLRWLAAGSTALLTVGLIPAIAVSPASAAPDPCNVTITPSVTDDSATLGHALDASLVAASTAGCAGGATFYLGTTDDTFVYQLPKSLEWTIDDTLAIIGLGDDTPVLLAADDTRLLTVEVSQPSPGQAIYLTRLSMRDGSADHGGAVRVSRDPSPNTLTLVLQDMEFVDNSVGSGGAGGAIEARGDAVVAITSRFEGNVADDIGGAIGAGQLDIRGSTFINNQATYGGGGAIANWAGGAGNMMVGPEGGTPTRFIGNTSQFGGAILAGDTAVTAHIEAQFERNSAPPFDPQWDPVGGAIYTWGLTPIEISNSTFVDDSVTDSAGGGGAIWSDAPLTVTGSTFIGATAPVQGGAIAATSGVTIEQSYFEENASTLGGALAILGGPSNAISNSTFWGNSADDSGSGVYVDAPAALSIIGGTFDDSTTNNTSLIAVDGLATATLAGTILSKDASSAPTCEGSSGSIDDSGGNLVTATCGAITGTSVVSDDSLGLLPPALNQAYPNNSGTTPTIGLEPSSVAINHYDNTTLNADQRGVPRPQGVLDDAGAYEAGGIESITPLATTSATVGTPFSQSLSATGFGSGMFVWDDSGTPLPPGLTLSSTGVISGTPTTPGTYAFTARVTGPVDDSTTAQSITVSGVNPPGPAPATPASPPQEVRAIPAIESATVSWLPPTSTGTFPVTSYQAVATPGGQACMVTAPARTCTITGLTAGTSYTVTARALTGAGWSAESSPGATVVPLATPQESTILITSSRDRAQKSIARIEGTTTGLVGAQVVPYIRVAGKTSFTPGASTRTVDADGKFTWQRKAKKRFTVYFTSGDVTSNRLVIRPE